MTTVLLQTRADWGAVPPTAITPLNWSKVTKFIVHYSGASRLQSVRSIQRFCMEDKGHSDIDYNELVRDNVLYVGRGDNVGSHTLNNNSTSYGLCMIGVDGDATPDDMNVIRSRYDYACQRAGRVLAMMGHQQAPTLPPGYTDCPGPELQSWINDGMPYQNRVTMFFQQITGSPDIYLSDGFKTRKMLTGTWETTCQPLINSGVPHLVYASEEARRAGGGPLVDPFDATPIDVPTVAKISFPPGTVTLE